MLIQLKSKEMFKEQKVDNQVVIIHFKLCNLIIQELNKICKLILMITVVSPQLKIVNDWPEIILCNWLKELINQLMSQILLMEMMIIHNF